MEGYKVVAHQERCSALRPYRSDDRTRVLNLLSHTTDYPHCDCEPMVIDLADFVQRELFDAVTSVMEGSSEV